MHGATNSPIALDDPRGIATRMDRLPMTPMHFAAFAVCAAGMFFDCIELAMAHVLGTVFTSKGSAVAHGPISMLMASAFLGAAIGAPLLGRFADRRGRKFVLLACLVGIGLTSVLAGMTTNISVLTLLRLLSGVFLGGYMPVMMTYLADILPSSERGRWLLVVSMVGAIAGVGAAFLTRWLGVWQPLGVDGWRWVLGLGGVGAFLSALFVPWIPESPRWLLVAGRAEEAEVQCNRFKLPAGKELRPLPDAPKGDIPAESAKDATMGAPAGVDPQQRISVWDIQHRGRTLLYLFLQFVAPWANISFLMLSGLVFAKRGFSVNDSLLIVALATIGAPLGCLLGAMIVDRFERPVLLASCSVIAAVMALAFVFSPVPMLAVGAGVVYNLLMAIFVPLLMVFGAELLPTAIRATLATGGYASNRVSAMMVPVVLLPLLYAVGEIVVYCLLAALLVTVAIVILRWAPRGTVGRSLR
jgi:putative MFS transporter